MCINNKNMKIKTILKTALSNNFFITNFKGLDSFLFHDISDEMKDIFQVIILLPQNLRDILV